MVVNYKIIAMKPALKFILLLVIFPLLLSAQSFDTVFKKAEWLTEHLDDENLIILHVDTEDNYTSGHIPGAQFIRMNNFTTFTEDSIYRELPTTGHLDSLFRAYGITDNSTIILYYGGDLFASAFRLYFTFDYLGLADNVFILDGGLKNWINAELKTSVDTFSLKSTAPGQLNFKVNSAVLADKNDVKEIIGNEEVRIIDARRDAFYTGEKDGDGRYKRPGHIAGAKNITWLDLIDENQKIKSSDKLRRYFIDQEIFGGQKIITYCHVGLRATVLYTIAKCLGHSTKMYDGSYNEWDRLDDSYGVDYTFDNK